MTNLKNELPVQVHVGSGGCGRVRSGGTVVSLNGVSSGSFQVTGATGFRGLFNNRTVSGLMLLIGYASPISAQNAVMSVSDLQQIADDVPEGTTVYFATFSADGMIPTAGGMLDTLNLSFYS